jgi:hypothetical protein
MLVFHLLASWIKIMPLTIQCTSWLLDQQNITWMTAFQYFHNLYVLCYTVDKPETCKWPGLTLTSSHCTVFVWRLHDINCTFMCLGLSCYQPIHMKCEETAQYAGAHCNHLNILCINVKSNMSYIREHLQCKSLYPKFSMYHIAWPACYNIHLIFLWRAVGFNARLLKIVM